MLDGATYNPKWNGNASKYLEGKLKILMDSRGLALLLPKGKWNISKL
jgi:hypothetical protein